MFLPEMRFQVEIDKKKGTHTAVAFYLHFARKISTHKNEPQYRPCSQIISMSFLYARNGPLNELAFYLTLLEVLSDQIELENIISCIFFPLTNVPTAARTMETSEMVKKESSLWAISTQISTSLIIKPNRFYAY